MALVRTVATPKRRSLGFSAERVSQMYTPPPVDPSKYNWFKLPNGPDGQPLEFWSPGKNPGIYEFDILAITHSHEYSLYWAQQQVYRYPTDFWFSRRVRTHRVQSDEYLCKNSLYSSRDGQDCICKALWKDKEEGTGKLDYMTINRTYEIFLIRMHLAEGKYKFYIYIDSYGKFGKILYDEYEILKNTPEDRRTETDLENLLFFDPFEKGKTISARFTMSSKNLPDRTTGRTTTREWLACTKIDFIDRVDPLTIQEQDWIADELDIDGCLVFPEDSEYDKALKLLLNESVTEESSAAPEEAPEEAPAHVERQVTRPRRTVTQETKPAPKPEPEVKQEVQQETKPEPQAEVSTDDDPFAEEFVEESTVPEKAPEVPVDEGDPDIFEDEDIWN